ncbi:MAG: DUF1579 domain-containing protein [Phycisphaerales bacterium]|nr:DUF1579 domain-containing protein [Phycisphaerales bacterium]
MTWKNWLAGLTLVSVTALVTSTALSQDHKNKKSDHPAAQAGGEMDPEMAAWMAAGAVNENHKLLEYMVGSWNCEVTNYCMGPDPATSRGKSTAKWALDGRFVSYEFDGDFMGTPFHGIGYTGYDNIQKKYVSLWMDSMSTAIFTDAGDYDASSKTFTYHGEMASPTGGKIKTRSTIEIADKDHHVMTFYHAQGDEPEARVMQITYRRANASASAVGSSDNG